MSPATAPTDYIVKFDNRDQAISVFTAVMGYSPTDVQLASYCWTEGIATFLDDIKVITQEAQYDEDDDGFPVLASPAQYADGYWVVVRLMTHVVATQEEQAAKALLANHANRVRWEDVPGRVSNFFAGSLRPSG